MKTATKFFIFISAACFVLSIAQGLRGQTKGVTSGQRYDRLVIKNVIVVDGKGTPPRGPYDVNWTTTDEVFWRENYKIWMKAVRDFANLGGVVGIGEDAGYINQLYGFALIRELELHHEAGFHPIDVIQNATGNNSRLLGMENSLGRVRQGYLADLILVDGNPLENLKYLYPTGVMDLRDGKIITRGGVQWTIKDGIVYHGPTLLEDVKGIVHQAKNKLREREGR